MCFLYLNFSLIPLKLKKLCHIIQFPDVRIRGDSILIVDVIDLDNTTPGYLFDYAVNHDVSDYEAGHLNKSEL